MALPYTRDRSKRRAIIASVITGTTIEWYDFYLYATLVGTLGPRFFPSKDPLIGFLSSLAVYATGFAIRPVGAVFFGRMGDLKGRKSAFLATLLIMGGATTAIGLLPSYERIGVAAPMLLVLLRLLQGFALGGEYGGAAIFVAESVPDGERGYYTSFVQITATLGLFLSSIVILVVRRQLGTAAFAEWGWRLPFVFSMFLLAIAGWVRTQLGETPLWERLRRTHHLSREPLIDAATNWKALLLALFGATAGQGVIWYTAQFYSGFFMKTVLKVPEATATTILCVALLCGMPFFLVFGALSDQIGRKKLMVTGNLLAAILFFPIYSGMAHFSNPLNPAAMTALIFVQVLLVTVTYGPIAAFLVESFPARSRYTSLSIPTTWKRDSGVDPGWRPTSPGHQRFSVWSFLRGGAGTRSSVRCSSRRPLVRIWSEASGPPAVGTAQSPARDRTGPIPAPVPAPAALGRAPGATGRVGTLRVGEAGPGSPCPARPSCRAVASAWGRRPCGPFESGWGPHRGSVARISPPASETADR
jgi:MFS family permease